MKAAWTLGVLMLAAMGMVLALFVHQVDLQHQAVHKAAQVAQMRAVVARKQAAVAQEFQTVQQKQRTIRELKSKIEQESSQVQSLSGRSDGSPLSTQGSAWMAMEATWYSTQGGSGNTSVTATGARVRDNWTIAVDPGVIPLGSIVEIRFSDGTDRIYKAEDTGGAIQGSRIDIFDSSEAQCIQNGRQVVEARILVRG